MSDINLIVPPIAETQLTGFRLGAEKRIYGVLWRVEFWQTELYPLFFRDGTRVKQMHTVPEYAIKFANSVNTNILANTQ